VARDELVKNKGVFYNPKIVDAHVNLVVNKGFQALE